MCAVLYSVEEKGHDEQVDEMRYMLGILIIRSVSTMVQFRSSSSNDIMYSRHAKCQRSRTNEQTCKAKTHRMNIFNRISKRDERRESPDK